MSGVRRLLGRMGAFFDKRSLDAELEAELAAHLEMAIEENLERGLPRQKRGAWHWSASVEWNWRKNSNGRLVV